jgi:hypothetical protein
VGFADHKSASTATQRVGRKVPWCDGADDGTVSEESEKLMLDDDSNSSIEWQASLKTNQLWTAPRNAGRDEAAKSGGEK